MILVKPSYKILYCHPIDLSFIEKIGRVCYKSEDKITSDSSEKFIKNILKNGHESVLEHSIITVHFVIDRGVSHELVRHRLCAFSQESTRYCNYKGGVTFVIPPWFNEIMPGIYDNGLIETINNEERRWFEACSATEYDYIKMINNEQSPQQARSVLINSLKTEIVVSANFREWRHILKLRTSNKAHPQMQEIMRPLLSELQQTIPIIFEEVNYD